MFKLYFKIISTIIKGQKIDIPFRQDQSGELQRQWEIVFDLKRMSELADEVYAIWSSLSKAREQRLISNSERRQIIEKYKEAYGKEIFFVCRGL
jgi:hypothetical protein